MKTWMLTITGRKKYWGNESYGNDPVRNYNYDAYVQNHKALSVGDLVLIREGDDVTGVSTIQEINLRRKQKTLNECPRCTSGRVRYRKTMIPAWICECGEKFTEPNKINRRTVGYTATFDQQYRALRPPLEWQELDQAFSNTSSLSIRGVSVGKLMESRSPVLAPLKRIANELIGTQLENLRTTEVESAKRAIQQLQDFLEGCRSHQDESVQSGNKLELPISQSDFTALISGVDVVREQLDAPVPDVEKIESTSYFMARTRDYLNAVVEGAGTKTGELVVLGAVAKLTGYLDAVISALRTLF